MAINLQPGLMNSLLSQEHQFKAKILVSDKKKIKDIKTKDKVSIPCVKSTATVDETTTELKWASIDMVNINNKDLYFFTPEYAEGTITGTPCNKIQHLCKSGGSFSTPIDLDITYNVDKLIKAQFYFNSTCWQFGVVYEGTKTVGETSMEVKDVRLKRLQYNEAEDGTYTITEVDDNAFIENAYGQNFIDFTCQCNDDGELFLIHSLKNADDFAVKSVWKINLMFTDFQAEVQCLNVIQGNQTLGLSSCLIDNEFYYVETYVVDSAYVRSQIYKYTDYEYELNLFYDFYTDIYYNGSKVFLTTNKGNTDKYQIIETDRVFSSLSSPIFFNGVDSGANIGSLKNYKIKNSFVLWENEEGQTYEQDIAYIVNIIESDYEIELPSERILTAEINNICENGKPRTLKFSLANGDGFFTEYGEDPNTGLDFKEFFCSESVSNRTVKLYIGDLQTEDPMDIIYTGILEDPSVKIGNLSLTCQDNMILLQKGHYKDKIWSMVSADAVITELVERAGLNVRFDESTNFTIERFEIDRRTTLLDAITQIIEPLMYQMYCDRFGTIVITRRILHKENVITLDDGNVFDINKEGPSNKETRNIVRIITDNTKDPSVYVEARDEEAIVNMGIEIPMELDYTAFYKSSTASGSSETKYEYPTTDTLFLAAEKYIIGDRLNDADYKLYLDFNKGKYPAFSNYIYVVQWVNQSGSKGTYFVSCAEKVLFKKVGRTMHATFSDNRKRVLNCIAESVGGVTFRTFTYPMDNPYGVPIVSADVVTVTALFPNTEIFKDKKYEKAPHKEPFINFNTELEKYLTDAQVSINATSFKMFEDFMNTYRGTHEFYIVLVHRHGDHILGDKYVPPYAKLIAVKKDYTVLEPGTRMCNFTGPIGRPFLLQSADGRPKDIVEFHYQSPTTYNTTHVTTTSHSTGEERNSFFDFRYDKATNPVDDFGESAQNTANKILMQVCRTNEYNNATVKPMPFLEPEDIVYVNTSNVRVNGYRTVKQVNQKFNFQLGQEGYRCDLRLKDAIPNVDFFPVEDEEGV